MSLVKSNRIRMLLVTVGALLAVLPISSWAYNGVGLVVNTYILEGDKYRMDFIVENYGPDRDAVFKFTLWGIDPAWETISSWPPEWEFSHPDGLIDFQTGNGSYPADGFYRLFGQEGAPEPCYGWTGLVFQWTFRRAGGYDPFDFQLFDYRFHLQPIGDEWENAGLSYSYPGPIATEATTWGQVKTLCQ